jgi:hypothetical protein
MGKKVRRLKFLCGLGRNLTAVTQPLIAAFMPHKLISDAAGPGFAVLFVIHRRKFSFPAQKIRKSNKLLPPDRSADCQAPKRLL